MNKKDLAAKIASEVGITKKQAESAVNSFIGNVIKSLRAGEKVPLLGFGTFSVVQRDSRTGRNPQTGKEIKIAAKRVGKFSAGAVLKDLDAKDKSSHHL